MAPSGEVDPDRNRRKYSPPHLLGRSAAKPPGGDLLVLKRNGAVTSPLAGEEVSHLRLEHCSFRGRAHEVRVAREHAVPVMRFWRGPLLQTALDVDVDHRELPTVDVDLDDVSIP